MFRKYSGYLFPVIILILFSLSYVVFVFHLCFIGIVRNKHYPTLAVCYLGFFNFNFFMVIWCFYQVVTTEEPGIHSKFILSDSFIQRNKLESLVTTYKNTNIRLKDPLDSDVYNQAQLSQKQNSAVENYLVETDILLRTRNTFGN